jgi:hypothetical protein
VQEQDRAPACTIRLGMRSVLQLQLQPDLKSDVHLQDSRSGRSEGGGRGLRGQSDQGAPGTWGSFRSRPWVVVKESQHSRIGAAQQRRFTVLCAPFYRIFLSRMFSSRNTSSRCRLDLACNSQCRRTRAAVDCMAPLGTLAPARAPIAAHTPRGEPNAMRCRAQSALLQALQSRLSFAGAPAIESPAGGANSAGISNGARVEIHTQAALQSTNFNDT